MRQFREFTARRLCLLLAFGLLSGCSEEPVQTSVAKRKTSEPAAAPTNDYVASEAEPPPAATDDAATVLETKVAQSADEMPRPADAQEDSAVASEGEKKDDDRQSAEDAQPDSAVPDQNAKANEAKQPATDFVAMNGPIFENWPKPKMAILFSGGLDGYMEPCGCSGLEKKKGGLIRRHTLIRQLQNEDWPLAALDLGGLIKRMGPQAYIKYQRTLESMLGMGYQAIGFGGKDLRLPTQELLVTLPQDGNSPFVSANVSSIFDSDFGFCKRFKIVEAGGMRLGVTSVLGKMQGGKLQNPDFTFEDPEAALTKILPEIKKQNCDQLILLASMSIEDARRLAVRFPDFDFVVAAGDSDPPPPEVERIEGTTTRLVELGHKAMYIGVLAFFDDAKRSYRFQRVPLDGRFPDSKPMLAIMTSYQQQLKQLGLERLGLQPNPHPTQRSFVGSKECAECHDKAYKIWRDTPHAHAIETLVQLTPPRQFDPECISCHVTGWEPQEYYPFVSGYLSIEETPHLAGVGCENCHGPGSQHVAAERGDLDLDDDAIEALQQTMRLTYEDAKRNDCTSSCHDLDNSPAFDFEKYWPKIKH